MNNAWAYVRASAGITIALATISVAQAQFVPPAGFSNDGISQPGVAVPSDPTAPLIRRIPDTILSDLVRVDPAYKRESAGAHAKVVGAFAIAETLKSRVVAARGPGFLPVALSFSDGRCYLLEADYENGMLFNGRLMKTSCEGRRELYEPAVPAPPSGRLLRSIGSPWGYGAWLTIEQALPRLLLLEPRPISRSLRFKCQLSPSWR